MFTVLYWDRGLLFTEILGPKFNVNCSILGPEFNVHCSLLEQEFNVHCNIWTGV